MAKDPAFLFYSKDWIEGTAEMLPEEKGVYIDLLAQQHQTGTLPNDTRKLAMIARLGHDEFLRIWNGGLSAKFIANGSRLVNRKLTEVMTVRSEKGHKNKIIGHFASLVRKHKLTDAQKEIIKKDFDVNAYLPFSTVEATERLTEWFLFRLKSIGNGNANGNVNTVGENEGAGEGEPKAQAASLIGKMEVIWRTARPEYPFVGETDYPQLQSLSHFICKQEGLSYQPRDGTVQEAVLKAWQVMADFIAGDVFYKNHNLAQVSKYIQSISMKIINEKTGGDKDGKQKPGAKVTGAELNAEFAKRYPQS